MLQKDIIEEIEEINKMSTFTNYVEAKNKNLKELSNEEIYYLLLEFVKEAAASKPKNDSKRKVYYISAEFLIGKLLNQNHLLVTVVWDAWLHVS